LIARRFIAAPGFFQLDGIDHRNLGQLRLSGWLNQEQQGLDPPPNGK
jgi:hypothetical protein